MNRKPFNKGASWSLKAVEVVYRLLDSPRNNAPLARVLDRRLEDLADSRDWLLRCRCLIEGGEVIPQADCKRDTNYKSHGITNGIAFCGAVIRTCFEKAKGVGVTLAGRASTLG